MVGGQIKEEKGSQQLGRQQQAMSMADCGGEEVCNGEEVVAMEVAAWHG